MSESSSPRDHFPVVNRARVADQIVRQIQAQIAEGVLARGGKLPSERELATIYGVSAPTVREALRALSSMGLVEVRHGSGAYVAQNSQNLLDASLAMLIQWENASLLDLLGLYRVLFLYAGDLATESGTDAEFAAVRAAADATADARSTRDMERAVQSFMAAVVRCTHQPLLDALCGFLMRVISKSEATAHIDTSEEYWRQWAEDTVPYRRDVVDALEKRDKVRLRHAITHLHDHIREQLQLLPPLA